MIYNGSENRKKIKKIIKRWKHLWKKKFFTIKIFKSTHMSISLKSNWTNNHKINRVYSMKMKNQKFINEIFDKFSRTEENEIIFTIHFFWIFSFRDLKNDNEKRQIWKKKRVIINIRELNQITQINAYFMSFQIDITAIVIECNHISIVDVQKYFYQ